MKDTNCVADCNGKWLQAAYTLLQQNEIAVSVFSTAVFTLLEQGRGKYRNGAANCGKTSCFPRTRKSTTLFVTLQTAHSLGLARKKRTLFYLTTSVGKHQ